MSVAPDDERPADADTETPAVVADNPPLKPKADAVGKPRRLSSGRHGQRIGLAVIAADGAGVVTLDVETHARLWPALDGTHEPLALPLISPAEVALHHDADGFAVAALDTGGGLTVLDIDSGDMLVRDAALDAEPGYAHVLATGSGFVALRKDHQLDWIDRAGTRGGSIAPPPGVRIAGMFASAGRVLALVEDREGLRGQWLDAGPKGLTWGERTAKLDLEPEHVFMSPDGTRLVAMRPKGRGPAIFELATGAVKGMKTPDPAAVPRFELEVPQRSMNRLGIDPPGTLLGFASNDRVVFSDQDNGGPFAWYDLRGKKMAQMSPDIEFMFSSDQTVFGGGKAVSFFDRELAVMSPTRIDYLGYRRRSARGLAATRDGLVASVGALDDRLRATKRTAKDPLRVDDDLSLVPIAVAQQIDEAWLEKPEHRPRKAARVALYDRAAKREVQSWKFAPTTRRVHFEPATKLMMIDHGTKLEVATYDPDARLFGTSLMIEVPATTIELLDPAVAGGLVVITVHGTELRRWRAEDIAAATAPEPIALAAAPEAIDRAGHVYVRETPDTVVVLGGASEVRLHDLKDWTIVPNADGTRIAARRRGGAMLLDAQGTVLWTIGMPDLEKLVWSPDGALVAQARDLVELSVDDGSIVYAQCGWSFGRRTTPNEDFAPTDHTYCDR